MELPTDSETEYLLHFIESSKRGIGFSQPNRSIKGICNLSHLAANATYIVKRIIGILFCVRFNLNSVNVNGVMHNYIFSWQRVNVIPYSLMSCAI